MRVEYKSQKIGIGVGVEETDPTTSKDKSLNNVVLRIQIFKILIISIVEFIIINSTIN